MRQTALILGFATCIAGLLLIPASGSPDAPAAAAGSTTAPSGPADSAGPNPALSPGAVVKIVMEALQHNDDKDAGIEITFRFASPGNKEITGPLDHFAQMVKGPQYGSMLNFKSIQYGPLHVDGNTAVQAVHIVDGTGASVVYVFELAKQTEGAMKDCWMTDGVMRLEPQTQPGTPV